MWKWPWEKTHYTPPEITKENWKEESDRILRRVSHPKLNDWFQKTIESDGPVMATRLLRTRAGDCECAEDYEKILREDRIYEEEERQRRLRANAQQMRERMAENDAAARPGAVHCPYCKSAQTEKIANIDRLGSTVVWGAASGKLGKQWHCKKCGSDF